MPVTMRFLTALALMTSTLFPGRTEGAATTTARATEPRNFLSTVAGFSDAELAAVDQGSVVVKAVHTP